MSVQTVYLGLVIAALACSPSAPWRRASRRDPASVTPRGLRPRQNSLRKGAMSLSSYSDVFSISHEREYDEDICAGDLVRSGPNLFPHFEVIAVNGDKAWVRNVQNGADHLALLSRCRKIQPEPLAIAAE